MRSFAKIVAVGILLCVLSLALANVDSEDVQYNEDDAEENYDDDEDYSENNSTKNGTLHFVKELLNVTKASGRNVTFRCEVKQTESNSTAKTKLQFKWKKNYAEIKKNAKFRIKDNSKVPHDAQMHVSWLKIINLEPSDKGIYTCEASNGIDKLESDGILNVTGGNLGTFISELPVSFEAGESDLTTFNPSLPKGKTEFEPLLTRTEERQDPREGPNVFNVNPKKEPVYNASEPFCQIYSGHICKKLLTGRYVFIQPPYTQKTIEDKLSEAVLVVSQSNEISTSCSNFALPSLCYSAFPICSDYIAINNHQKHLSSKLYSVKSDLKKNVIKNVRLQLTKFLQRICKEECLLLENELCSKEYAIAKRHPVIGPVLELEECEYLPDKAEDNDWSCLKLGVDSTTNINIDDTCYWDNGEMYRGVQDAGESKNKCIRWTHQFQIPLSEYPELTGHSYCRNPGGKEVEPFCYTEPTKRETCGIPKCANILWIHVISTICALLLLILGITYFCCRRKNNSTRTLKNMNVPSADKNIYGNGGPSSPIELNTLLPGNIPPARNHHPHNKNNYQNVPNYTYKEVTFVEELGEGAFGKVYKGELKTKSGKIFVAVKSLKENANAKTQADFQREIELISELKHTNIICLLGVVMKQEPMCMIFEYMSEGDLHEFLMGNSPSEDKSLSQIQFLQIAIQIAQGMEYLSENHYVHRDLAARNCLVSNDLVVKISDFGLSRDMYSCDYYRVQSKSLLPVRWMPPESILYGKFTTESDVWSYGVVLWEIYSYGLQPYYGYNNQQVINMIRARKLLPCPDACPSYCYALMIECWAELAIRRPSFAEICHRLRVWKQNGCSTGAYFKNLDNYASNSMKHGHSSKSSHTTDSQTLCPTNEAQNEPTTWERSLQSANKLNLSQSSLTSHSSSLGNKTQSTSLSDPQNTRHSRKSIDRKSTKSSRNDGSIERRSKNNFANCKNDAFDNMIHQKV